MNSLFANRLKCFVVHNVKKYSKSCIYKDEFSVSQFCNLNVKVPFSINIKPLDVHAYPNSDKLIIKIFSNKSTTKPYIHCTQDNENFHISTDSEYSDSALCLIETPVKSDLNVKTTGKGSIDIKKFKGNNIFLETESGDITSENCQTSKINFKSTNGNIATLGTLHAAEIILKTGNHACIAVNHLQSLNASVTTENGDITVKSSYCDQTEFHTKSGKLLLDNVHKKCCICISENGSLRMTGFNGTLNASITNGNADIQMSKVYDFSTINIQEKNFLLLRLSEWIQENTKIDAKCQQLKVADNVKLLMKNTDTSAVLVPENSEFNSDVIINCKLCSVCIEEASWLDMLKLKGIKFINE